MIISVASGKGGTGKTTVSTNLAMALDAEVIFLDCDVEEPNAHLFLQPKVTNTQPSNVFVPLTVEEKCNGCRACADICRFKAITVIGESVLLFPELCHGCGGCVEVCQEGALLEGERSIGVIESGNAGKIHFHHAILNVGEPMSPPLIKHLRSIYDKNGIVIIDAPPGTSCPVIAAMKDSDFVLLVTEPTPFGLHDLILAHEAVKTLNIPCGLVINRSTIGNDKVHKYAGKNDLPILLEIPFDREIAELYSEGHMLVSKSDDWKRVFENLYKEIAIRLQ